MSRKRLAPPQRAVRTFSGNRQARKDFLDGAVEDRVGDREEAHEKEIGALGRNPGRLGHGFTEEAAGNGGTNELGGLSPAMAMMARMEIQRRNSVSPSKSIASRTP